METLIYQGQPIEAEKVAYHSGNLAIATYGDYEINHDGDEDLFRDPAGRYYLRRDLNILDVAGHRQAPASGRTYTHRLSLCGVLQRNSNGSEISGTVAISDRLEA